MSESFQDKTEDATPKKLADARKEGNVPKSSEFNSVFILLFGVMTLYFLSTTILQKLYNGFQLFYRDLHSFPLTEATFPEYFVLGLKAFAAIVGPLVAIIVLIGIGINIAQFGFLFSTKSITPDFKRINPLKGFKKFVSPKSFVELAKSILKVSILSIIAYQTIMSARDEYLLLIHSSVGKILFFISKMLFQIVLRTTVALFVLALADLLYQRWQYKKDLKMTKQEVKDEMKQAEGDPQVKSHIRSLQLSRSRERMMQKVEEADVIITNPTRLAIALKYNPEDMDAPVVLAKGARLIAKRIRKLALEHNIPIVENKPLAQSLYKMCEVGKEIPFELFQAVAEVFAYVYQLKNRKN